ESDAGEPTGEGDLDAEDEDAGRRGQAAQAARPREAQAGGRLEAAQAREEGSAAAPEAPRGEADRQGGRGPAAGARAVSIGERHATGQGWRQDTPSAQEDPQEGEGVFRRAPQALPDSRRDRPARGRLRVPRPQAEEARGA